MDQEREFRQRLARKVSGSCMGAWLLAPELLRIGAWELLTGWTRRGKPDMDPRIALQLVHETALCTGRIRRKNSLAHQGLAAAAGMGQLVSDEQVHRLLDGHSLEQAYQLMIQLGHQRRLCGHYRGEIVAIDPHRILSTSKRVMAKKKKTSQGPSKKMLQTFFSVCGHTGQPIMATMGSTGVPTTYATKTLVEATARILPKGGLLVADKEHYTHELLSAIDQYERFELLVPAMQTTRLKSRIHALTYKRLWAGFAIAETTFCFAGSDQSFRLIAQRTGEVPGEYEYTAFVSTSQADPTELITRNYGRRWSIENFFNFENKMGLHRASTLNLNIRYGKLALDMMSQAATYGLRSKLKTPYQRWNAEHLAREVLAWVDGDIRVKDDTIVVTFYGAPDHLDPTHYTNLPGILQDEGIDPRIPWLYNFKLDFRFK